MTATVRVSHRTAHPHPARGAVRRLAVRQLRRGAVVVTVVCAGMSALVAVQYQTTFEGEASRHSLSALAGNPAIRVLFGAPVALDDPGGFTVWRTGTPVMLLAGVWLMLAAIRITRGDEDAGRWSLLLGGGVRITDVVVQCAVAVAGAAVMIGAAIGLALVAAGTQATGALVYALGVLGATAVFGAVGLASAQVMPSRPSAVGVAVGVLGATLLLRMVADGVGPLAFSSWLTPFGLIGRVAPYAHNRLLPLAVLAVFALVTAAAAVVAARGRDLGEGWVPVRTHRAARRALLGGPAPFAIRRALRPTLGWLVGIGTYFVIVGAMIASVLEFFDANPRFSALAAGAGFGGLDSATGFAAALFSLLSIPTGLYASTRLASMVADERAQRWTLLLAAPLSRPRLLAAEIAVTAAGVLTLHLVAALAIWLGAVLTGAPLQLTDAVVGAANTAPVAWLALGAAALAVGWLPTAVTSIGALPVVGGFLLFVVADTVKSPDWVSNISPFVHVAPSPALPPDWPAIAAFIVIGAVMIGAGVVGYRRRDIAT